MNIKDDKNVSRFLSLVLRHEPGKIGLRLDEAGWVSVAELLERCQKAGVHLDLARLERIVETNDKKRFAFDGDRTRIRASQGHSVEMELGYPPAEPPGVLYHGTYRDAAESILKEGIHKGKRHDVHLSASPSTAVAVGQRRGEPVVLTVDSGRMHREGFLFYRSENGVWLTDSVPADFIKKEMP